MNAPPLTQANMSDLQRAWAKKALQMGATAESAFDEREEDEISDLMPQFSEAGGIGGGDDDSSSASSASSASSTGTIVPSASQKFFARPAPPRNGGREMTEIPWTTYFERELFLPRPSTQLTFHAYLTSPVANGPLFAFHHGGGSSGLSFAVVASEIRRLVPDAGILSIDARGHGLTRDNTNGPHGTEPRPDLRLETLTEDLHFVICATKDAMRWPALPQIVLVGHSLGGAVVTNLAYEGLLGTSVLALAVLDVVEGSAMDALQSMQTYLSTRPSSFPSLAAGIEWHVRSRTIRRLVSARTSVPALLVQDDAAPGAGAARSTGEDGGIEAPRRWRWRTDLAATQEFWEGWFVGLSKKFLGSRGGKMLLLAGTDRLDTELTIGQMQGKYNLQVFPEAGHFIHEDLPEKTAVTLADFYRRNDRSLLVLPPKVSELLKQGKKV